jgi:tetratricopeptide (TPR) repeat protein
MIRAAAFSALLCLAAPAGAFFFGGTSDERAGELLAGMRAAHGVGNCSAVLAASEKFMGEKPPERMREEAYGYMGRCYEALDSVDKAISLYKLALGLHPENVLFSYRLARIYNQAGFHQLAVPLFLKSLSLYPDDPEANLGLARAYTALGFLGRAKEFYSKAVILQDFRDAAALEEYARSMLRKGDWGEALFIAAKGEEASPKSAVWPALEARAMAGQGKFNTAITLMESAISLETSRELRLERALYQLMGGLPNRAAQSADAELAAAPGDALAAAVKGMALYSLGRKGEAEAYFLRARSGGPFTARVAESFLKQAPAAAEDACKK